MSLHKFVLLLVIMCLCNIPKVGATDTDLHINISPIICTLDNVNNGVTSASYLTPENCSNYYELFPTPVGQNNPLNLRQNTNQEVPIIVIKKPKLENKPTTALKPSIADDIRNDPVTSMAVSFLLIGSFGYIMNKYNKLPLDTPTNKDE